MKMRLLALTVGLGLSACTNAQLATVSTDLTTAKNDLTNASTYIGVVEGIAGVAEIADPATAVVLAPLVSVLDGLKATATTTLASATADAPTVENLVTTINAQAAKVANAAAPAIKVVGNGVKMSSLTCVDPGERLSVVPKGKNVSLVCGPVAAKDAALTF